MDLEWEPARVVVITTKDKASLIFFNTRLGSICSDPVALVSQSFGLTQLFRILCEIGIRIADVWACAWVQGGQVARHSCDGPSISKGNDMSNVELEHVMQFVVDASLLGSRDFEQITLTNGLSHTRTTTRHEPQNLRLILFFFNHFYCSRCCFKFFL